MLERTFFRGHSVSKILAFDHVTEGGQIVGHLIINSKIWPKTKENMEYIYCFDHN